MKASQHGTSPLCKCLPANMERAPMRCFSCTTTVPVCAAVREGDGGRGWPKGAGGPGMESATIWMNQRASQKDAGQANRLPAGRRSNLPPTPRRAAPSSRFSKRAVTAPHTSCISSVRASPPLAASWLRRASNARTSAATGGLGSSRSRSAGPARGYARGREWLWWIWYRKPASRAKHGGESGVMPGLAGRRVG